MNHKASRINRVHLTSGGYTHNGQYYGVGDRLYEVSITYKTEGTDTAPPEYVDAGFRFRAVTYQQAKALVKSVREAKPTFYAIQRALNGERSAWTHD